MSKSQSLSMSQPQPMTQPSAHPLASSPSTSSRTKLPSFTSFFLSFPKQIQQEQLQRFKGICALYGYESFLRLQNAHVLIIGNGGVGSWIAESLCRTGVGAITLLDFDTIEISNTNRQLHTLSSTIGAIKSDTLGKRLLDINPYLKLRSFAVELTKDNVAAKLNEALDLPLGTLESLQQSDLNKIKEPHQLARERFDEQTLRATTKIGSIEIPNNLYVAEAIDDLFAKASCVDLLHRAHIPQVTSGGAGGRIDPSRVRLGDLTQARGDQLIKRLRTELRRHYGYPKGVDDEAARKVASRNCRSSRYNGAHAVDPKFNILCSYSDEVPMRSVHRMTHDQSPDSLGLDLEILPEQPQFGAAVTVTASAGLLLASVIIRWIVGCAVEH